MNCATNEQPGAGHGNGSVSTQYQPAWSSSPSPAQISSSTSAPVSSMTPARPSWKSPASTAEKVATSGSRPAAGGPAEAKIECALLRSVERELQLGLRIGAEAVRPGEDVALALVDRVRRLVDLLALYVALHADAQRDIALEELRAREPCQGVLERRQGLVGDDRLLRARGHVLLDLTHGRCRAAGLVRHHLVRETERRLLLQIVDLQARQAARLTRIARGCPADVERDGVLDAVAIRTLDEDVVRPDLSRCEGQLLDVRRTGDDCYEGEERAHARMVFAVRAPPPTGFSGSGGRRSAHPCSSTTGPRCRSRPPASRARPSCDPRSSPRFRPSCRSRCGCRHWRCERPSPCLRPRGVGPRTARRP